jgi:hypothetical protein
MLGLGHEWGTSIFQLLNLMGIDNCPCHYIITRYIVKLLCTLCVPNLDYWNFRLLKTISNHFCWKIEILWQKLLIVSHGYNMCLMWFLMCVGDLLYNGSLSLWIGFQIPSKCWCICGYGDFVCFVWLSVRVGSLYVLFMYGWFIMTFGICCMETPLEWKHGEANITCSHLTKKTQSTQNQSHCKAIMW